MLGVGGELLPTESADRQPQLRAGLVAFLAGVEAVEQDPGLAALDFEAGTEELVQLRRGLNRAELVFARSAHRLAQDRCFREETDLQPVGWIKQACRMGGHAAAGSVTVGAQLERLPASLAELRQGGIGFAHLALLAATAQALSESPSSRGFCEERLLDRARTCSLPALHRLCAHYRHAQDPQGYARDEAQSLEARFLELKAQEDGSLWLKGRLDGEGGAVLRTALEPLARRQGRADERRRDRRLADALIEIAGQGLDSGRLPSQGGQRPHLQITASLQTLLQEPGATAADLERGAPLSALALERLSCDSTVHRLLLDSRSMVIDLGRARRVISPAQRRALLARDGGCRWPGCERPGCFCVGHHLKHWARGGPTQLENLAMICYRHHLRLHEGGWSAFFSPDGRLVVVPPSARGFGQGRSGPLIA